MSSTLASYPKPQLRTEGFDVVTSPMGKGTPVTLSNFYPVRAASASLASNRKAIIARPLGIAPLGHAVIGGAVISADRLVELKDDKVFTSHKPALRPLSSSKTEAESGSIVAAEEGANESISTVASTTDPMSELRGISPVAGPYRVGTGGSGTHIGSRGGLPRPLGPREISMNEQKFRAQQEAASRPISRGLDLFTQAYTSLSSQKRALSANRAGGTDRSATTTAPSLVQQYIQPPLPANMSSPTKAYDLGSLMAITTAPGTASGSTVTALNASFASVATSSNANGSEEGRGPGTARREDMLDVSCSTVNGIPIVETEAPKHFGFSHRPNGVEQVESADLKRLRSLRQVQRKESQSVIRFTASDVDESSTKKSASLRGGSSHVEDSLRRIESKGVFSALLRQRDSFVPASVLPLQESQQQEQSSNSKNHMVERSGIARRVKEYDDEQDAEERLEEDFWSRAAKHQGIRMRLMNQSYREIEERIDHDRMRRLDSPLSGQSRRFLSSTGNATSAPDLSVSDFKIVVRDLNNGLRPVPALPKNFKVCAPDFDDQTGHRLWKLEDKANVALPGTEAECGYGRLAHPPASPSRPGTALALTDRLAEPVEHQASQELSNPLEPGNTPALIRDTDMLIGLASKPTVQAHQSHTEQDGHLKAPAVRFRPSSGDLLTRQYQLRAIATAESRAAQLNEPFRNTLSPDQKRCSDATASSSNIVTPIYTPRLLPTLHTPPPGTPPNTPALPLPTQHKHEAEGPTSRSSLQVKEMQRRLRRSVETEDQRLHIIQRDLDDIDHTSTTDYPTPIVPTFSPTSAKLINLDGVGGTSPSAFAAALNNSLEAVQDGSLVWNFEAERIRQQSRAAARGKKNIDSTDHSYATEMDEDEGWTTVSNLKESKGWDSLSLRGISPSPMPHSTLSSQHMQNLHYYQYQQRMQQQQAAAARGGPKQRESQKLRSKIERLEQCLKTEVPNITIQFYNVAGLGDSVSDKNEITTRTRSHDTPIANSLAAGAHQGSLRGNKHKKGSPEGGASLSLDGVATGTGSAEEVEELPALTGLKACSSILYKPRLQTLSTESSNSANVNQKQSAKAGAAATTNAAGAEMNILDTIASKEYPPLTFAPARRVTSELETSMPPQELHLYQMYCANSDVVIVLRPISSAAPSMYAGNFFVPPQYCDDDGIPLPVHEIKEDLDFEKVMQFTTSTCRIKGKGIGVSLKSSPYPPIEGFIPINPSLSKTYSEARRKERLLEDNLMRAGGNASDKLSMNLLAKIRAQHSMFGAATSVAMKEIEQSLKTSKAKLMELVSKYNEESAFTVDKLSVSEKYIDKMNEAQFLGKTTATWRGMDLYYRQLGGELEVERFNDGVPIFYARRGELLFTYDPKTNELKKGADSVLKFEAPSTFRKVEILTHRSFIISPESKRIIKDPGRAFIIGPDFDGFAYSHALPKALMDDPTSYMNYCAHRINVTNVPSMGLVSPLDVEHVLEARALTQWKQNHGYECQNTIKTQEITDGSHVAILPTMEVRCLHNFVDLMRFYRECWLRGYPLILNPNWKVVLCNETKMPVPFGDEISLPIIDDCGMALVVHSISAEGKQYDAVKAEALRLTKGMEEQIAIKKGQAPVGARVHPRPMLFSGNVVMQLATTLAKKALAEKFYAVRRWLLMPPCFITNKRAVVSEHTFDLIALPPVGHNEGDLKKGRTHKDIQQLMSDQGIDLADSVFGTSHENSISAEGAERAFGDGTESMSSNSANASLAGMRAMHLTVPISEEFEALREQKLVRLLADFEEACADFDGCFIDDCGRFTKMLKQFVEFQTVGDPTNGAAASALQGNGEALSEIIEDEVVLVKAPTAPNSVLGTSGHNQLGNKKGSAAASPMNGSMTISPPSTGLDSAPTIPLRGRTNSVRSGSILSADVKNQGGGTMTSGAFYQTMQGLLSRTMSNMSDTQQPGGTTNTTPQRSRRSSFTANAFLLVPQLKQLDFEGHKASPHHDTPKSKTKN